MLGIWKMVLTTGVAALLVGCDNGSGCPDFSRQCGRIVAKVTNCESAIEAEKCAGYSNCSVWIKDDAQSSCEKNLCGTAVSEVDAGVAQIEAMSCSELATFMAPYIETQYALSPEDAPPPSVLEPFLRSVPDWLEWSHDR